MLKGTDIKGSNAVKLLDLESYDYTFGPKKQRKKPNMGIANTLEKMLEVVDEKKDKYAPENDRDLKKLQVEDMKDAALDKRVEAGQSKRIWEELYKVIDSSDVVI